MSATLPTIVYFLCFLTSAACAALLGRMFYRSGVRLLFWSAACFVFLALNNLIVIFDMLIFVDQNFRVARLFASLAAVLLLLFGFTWESED